MTTAAQQFYGRWARLYDLLARYTPGIRTLRRQAVAACRLDPGDTVVEMGCGTGANLPFLSDAVGHEGTVVGVDFTRPVLDRARDVAARAGCENVHVVHGDATRPPVAGDVDAVLASFVVGMLDDPAGTVDDWCDLLAPAGHCVLVDAASSDRRFAAPLNLLFRGVVVASTPPTLRFRYPEQPTATLDRRVASARDRLQERAVATAHHESLYGVVRVTGGRLPGE